jgi:hypothetical protein
MPGLVYYLRTYGIVPTLVISALSIIPLSFLYLGWREICRFCFPDRRRDKPQNIEIPDQSEVDQRVLEEEKTDKSKQTLRWKKADAWYQPPGIGPRGYR